MSGAVARVRVVVEVRLGDAWGDDCPIGQLRAQASGAAQEAVRRAIAADASSLRVVETASVDLVATYDGASK